MQTQTIQVNPVGSGYKPDRFQLLEVAKNLSLLDYKPCSPIHKNFHRCTDNTRAVFGGNRSGKTTAMVVDALWQAFGIHPVWSKIKKPPLEIRIVATDYLNGIEKNIKPKLDNWIPRGRAKFHSKKMVYELDNGSMIELMSNDQEVMKFGGVPRDLTCFDEAPRREIWQECQMRHIDRGGCSIIAMTPPLSGEGAGEDSWTYDDLFLKDGTDSIRVFNPSTYDNPHNSRDMIEFIGKGLDETEKQIRFYGKFASLSGRVFKEFDPSIHVIDDFDIRALEQTTGQNWVRVCSFDPHPNAPFAGLYMAIDPFQNKYFYDEVYIENLNLRQLSHLIKSKEGKDRILRRLIDPRAGVVENKLFNTPSVKDQLREYGISADPANSDFESYYFKKKEDLTPKTRLDGSKKPSVYWFRKGVAQTIYQNIHYVWDRHIHDSKNKEKKQIAKKNDYHQMDNERYLYNGNFRWYDEKMERLNNERWRLDRHYNVVQ